MKPAVSLSISEVLSDPISNGTLLQPARLGQVQMVPPFPALPQSNPAATPFASARPAMQSVASPASTSVFASLPGALQQGASTFVSTSTLSLPPGAPSSTLPKATSPQPLVPESARTQLPPADMSIRAVLAQARNNCAQLGSKPTRPPTTLPNSHEVFAALARAQGSNATHTPATAAATVTNTSQQQPDSSTAGPATTAGNNDNNTPYPSAANLLLGAGKRNRSISDQREAPEARKVQCVERSASVLSIPATVVAQPYPPPKSSVPGVMAPGPNPADAGCSSTSSELPVCESMWPVMPYIEAVEHLLKDPQAQPLTFHRRVTRPMTHFIAAVTTALRLKDTSRLGAGMLFLRALIRDDVYGRLAVYDTMQGHAERADWSAFFLCVCEYLESAGFDISKLFTNRP